MNLIRDLTLKQSKMDKENIEQYLKKELLGIIPNNKIIEIVYNLNKKIEFKNIDRYKKILSKQNWNELECVLAMQNNIEQLTEQLSQKEFELKAADHALAEKDLLAQKYDKMYSDLEAKKDDFKRMYSEAMDKLSEKEKELLNLRTLLYQVEIYMEQEAMNDEYDGIWRDDDGIILDNVKKESLNPENYINPNN